MAVTTSRGIAPVVRKVLWADASLELLMAVALAGFAWPMHAWLVVSEIATRGLAIGFAGVAVALAVAAISRRTSFGFVRVLAWANIAGGVGLWLLLFGAWGHFPAEGRWILAAAGDSFIAIGVLELVALRRMVRR